MSQPVFWEGAWWAQRNDGSWMRWNEREQRWDQSPTPSPTGPAYQPASYYPTSATAYTSQRTNAWAIASLILGILWLWWVGAVLAIAFGLLALREIRNSDGREGGKGLAISGIVLGSVWCGFGLIGLGAHFIDLPS